MESYPEDLHKRVNLFKHFWNLLVPNPMEREPNRLLCTFDSSPVVYIRKWAKVDDGYIFRLSNKLVQVSFNDKNTIVMNGEKHEVIFENNKGESMVYSLSNVMKSGNEEMITRLKRAKELLNQAVNPKE